MCLVKELHQVACKMRRWVMELWVTKLLLEASVERLMGVTLGGNVGY